MDPGVSSAVASVQSWVMPAVAWCALLGLCVAAGLFRSILLVRIENKRMLQIASAIELGAKAYLNRQFLAITGIAAFIFAFLLWKLGLPVALGFVVGAACSLAAGFLGMRVAVLANVRTAQSALLGRRPAQVLAFNGGAVTGLLVVGLALLSTVLFFRILERWQGHTMALRSLVGLALGASLISVFARLGGGIYTKAADVGADLVGKMECHLSEDDACNPATIADNVGDNVGDCAGMAADIFETYAVSLIGAVLIAALTLRDYPNAVLFPFALGGISILSAILGVMFVNLSHFAPAPALMSGLWVSGGVSAVSLWPVTQSLFAGGVALGSKVYGPSRIYFAALIGLVLTGLVVAITHFYTSVGCPPVRRIARASETGHATNIIAGLAMGQEATALPVLCIGGAILASYELAGLYGVAVALMSMLSMAGMIISLDAFGPITDNAGGIAVMSGLPAQVREITDELDAVGNTMKAVTKGYAIASAGLAAVVLFATYVEELRAHLLSVGRYDASALDFSLKDPKVIVGLFLGGLLPYLFSAFSMDAVGRAAGAVVDEVHRQIQKHPGILTGIDLPEYGPCVDIVTQAALREMIVPALLPVLFVVGVAAIPALGKTVLGGLLVGTIVTGLFIGLSMTSSGGAWDNAKKLIEQGGHGGKHSPAHAASITGDTVGDPYKDTSGPAINPMIKVTNLLAILVIPLFF